MSGSYLRDHEVKPLQRSRAFSGLPQAGERLFVRLFSKIGTTWLARDYTAGPHHLTVRAISSDGAVAKKTITVELRGAL